ncbi:uncharacterized protein ARMOST_02442 [Armillaria ostoyae]|uniref:Uncharacterized protein n=1 Tax=Armillaria ostoyae TaxID=47428 RepID=A0A284QRR9_ARMOS|nr:uncharacterized protein ARMOST_02442 [Armillaria ostoyae]
MRLTLALREGIVPDTPGRSALDGDVNDIVPQFPAQNPIQHSVLSPHLHITYSPCSPVFVHMTTFRIALCHSSYG